MNGKGSCAEMVCNENGQYDVVKGELDNGGKLNHNNKNNNNNDTSNSNNNDYDDLENRVTMP